jgi:ABC-type nickel/cobalt efflux system permease component RcnA
MNPLFYASLFSLGALDALSPGHAKSLVSTTLLGSKARFDQLFLLGLVVTVTHIAVNGLLAFLILQVSSTILDSLVFQQLELIVGIAVISFALFLIWQRFKPEPAAGCCEHGHGEVDTSEPLPFWQVVFLGVTSGLVPCPVVLVAMISALSVGQGMAALMGVTVFSLGMGTVIFLVGVVTILGVRHLSWFRQRKNLLWINRASAVLVLFIGGFIVSHSLFFYEMEAEEPIQFFMVDESPAQLKE